MKINKQKGGIIRWLVTIIAIIALASFFFNFSIQAVVENEQTQENASYITTKLNTFYQEHLAANVGYIWNNIIVDLFWNNIIDNMERIKKGEPTNIGGLSSNTIIK